MIDKYELFDHIFTHRTLTVMGTSPVSWTWVTRRAATWHRPTCCPSPYASTRSGRISASTWASATTSWSESETSTGEHQIRAGEECVKEPASRWRCKSHWGQQHVLSSLKDRFYNSADQWVQDTECTIFGEILCGIHCCQMMHSFQISKGQW